MIIRKIPSSGEELPVIGIGTWKSFDVDQNDYPGLTNVLSAMHEGGGRLIDSSPMYGKSEKVIGVITSQTPSINDFFYATKVWTTGKEEGIRQMEDSMKKMGRTTMDLMQIHNLTDWKTHLAQLRRWKEEGVIRYIGITHYTDDSHEKLEEIIIAERPDFVQFNYSIESRNAEKRLLDAASDLGVATLINRPFGTGNLFNKVKGKALPAWATEHDINNWSEYFLKYLIAHPAVTCVIPATSNEEHERQNVKAGIGKLPDHAVRKMMIGYLHDL